jgi:hypothetical protein
MALHTTVLKNSFYEFSKLDSNKRQFQIASGQFLGQKGLNSQVINQTDYLSELTCGASVVE